MPGIAGVINFEDTPNSERVVDAMVASMQNERFYVSGTHATPEMGTYVGWAAHKNSFAASQLFLNEQHDIALIVAGECFVDSNTLIGLIKKGHRIENENDWIVHLYEEEGEQLFEKLNGLFSGVLHYRNVRP
jgi:asparagine synthetase B (glutamine-hydrolysing)